MSDDAHSNGATAGPKPRGRPFAKGVSGNPAGRPKADPEVVEALRALTPKAVTTLRKIIDDFNDHAKTSEGTERVPAAVARAAADSILDRFMGKAPAAPEDNDAISRGLGFTRDEVMRALLGRDVPARGDDPLAIPATTKE